MQRGPISPTKLLLRPIFRTPETEVPNESPPTTTPRQNPNSFPLRPRTKDKLLIHENDQVIADDYEVYLEVLLAAASSAKTEKHLQIDKITEEIVNRPDITQGATPLLYASINGNVHMAKFLLENGAEVDMWDVKKQVTPLMAAAANNRVEIIKLLLEHGCDVDAGLNSTTKGIQSALFWAILKNNTNAVSCLLEHGACQTSTVAFSETPMHASVARGSPEILKILINAQENHVKSEFQMGAEKNTPLHLASAGEHKNSLELCKILVEDGNAYINSPNGNGRTPLHIAVISQKPEIVKYLLSRFAKVNAADSDGRTPLFYAISEEPEALECIDALIGSEKCNINHQDKWGNSPLHLAGVCGSQDIAEILLMNGADFSAKANCGSSALSILRKKIPKTDELLRRSFDQAVTLINFEDKSNTGKQRQDCKMVVDFKYILPSANAIGRRPSEVSVESRSKSSRLQRMTTRLFRDMEEDTQKALSTRKETSKLKCLLEEEYSNLLLHPVIHSFLELKWQKARCVLLPTLIFKIVLVVLFSIYVQIPYVILEEETGGNQTSNATAPMKNSTTGKETNMEEKAPILFMAMYIIIVIMATIKGLMGLIQILRAPKQQLKTLHPWIAWSVLLIMVIYMQPVHWRTICSCRPFRRTMAALGILLAWLDVWIDMGRLPQRGLSIRVFMQVFKNFWHFILPHCCLLIGFILAFTLLFPDSGEFQSFVMALTKVIRVMAGDITIVAPGQDKVPPDAEDDAILAHVLLVYIYTTFVIMVSIVLGNLLIGLAVNDIQGIYKDAAADKLVKQTILLNTLETSFHGKWTRFCIPKEVFAKYINLFPSKDSDDKTITFNPYDPLDWQLSSDQKKELLSIGSVNQVAESQKENSTSNASSLKVNRLSSIAAKIMKMRKGSKADADEEKRVLMENINKLVMSYLESKNK